MHDIGDVVTLTTSLTDPVTGTPLDATTVQILVTAPDGAVTTLSGNAVEHPTTGVYQANYTTTQAGTHRYTWVGTGPVFAESGTFQVWPPLRVLSLADAKAHLNLTGTTDDEKLRTKIASTVDAVENLIGPLLPTPCTGPVEARTTSRPGHAGRSVFVLPTTPVITLDALTSTAGVAQDVSTAVVKASGVVSAVVPPGDYTAIWTAGRTRVPPDAYEAMLELLRHLWTPQRGGASRTAAGQTQQQPVPGTAHAFPYRVTELLAPYVQWGR